jgi:hypothetical protein
MLTSPPPDPRIRGQSAPETCCTFRDAQLVAHPPRAAAPSNNSKSPSTELCASLKLKAAKPPTS